MTRRKVIKVINPKSLFFMAILNGILKKLNGSAGSLTFKQVNGQTVVSEKPSTVRNSRTPSQQRQRTKWGTEKMRREE